MIFNAFTSINIVVVYALSSLILTPEIHPSQTPVATKIELLETHNLLISYFISIGNSDIDFALSFASSE